VTDTASAGLGRFPTREQGKGVLAGRARFRGVHDQAKALPRCQREGLERQVEVADDRVMQEFHATGVDADVVGGPTHVEVVAACGQLTAA